VPGRHRQAKSSASAAALALTAKLVRLSTPVFPIAVALVLGVCSDPGTVTAPNATLSRVTSHGGDRLATNRMGGEHSTR